MGHRYRVSFTLNPWVYEKLKSSVPVEERSKLVNELLRQYFLAQDDPPSSTEETERINLSHHVFAQAHYSGTLH